MKKCPSCKITKTVRDFYKDKYTLSGVKAYCKICSKERVHKYYYSNSEKVLKRMFLYKKNNRKKYRELLRIRQKKNRIKYKKYHEAVNAVYFAVRRGKITRGVCEVCGNKKVHAHHYLGYEKEHLLDIKWLCIRHHTEEHHAKRKIPTTPN